MERTADLTTFADEVRTESQEGDAVIERSCPSSSAFVLRASELVSCITAPPHANRNFLRRNNLWQDITYDHSMIS